MVKVRYEEMLPHEVVDARKKMPVAYLSIGTLEWHGEHLPLGYDGVKAHAMAIKAAEKCGGLAFPPLFWGDNREQILEFAIDTDGKVSERMGLPKSNFSPGYMHKSSNDQNIFYIELLINMCREIESLGFKAIVIFAGHYPLLGHARAAVEQYMILGKAKAWAVSGYEIVKDIIPDAGDHAGKWETSLLMSLRPDQVDMNRLPKDKKVPLLGVGKYSEEHVDVDPRGTASEEFGKFAIQTIMERVMMKVKKMLSE